MSMQPLGAALLPHVNNGILLSTGMISSISITMLHSAPPALAVSLAGLLMPNRLFWLPKT